MEPTFSMPRAYAMRAGAASITGAVFTSFARAHHHGQGTVVCGSDSAFLDLKYRPVAVPIAHLCSTILEQID